MYEFSYRRDNWNNLVHDLYGLLFCRTFLLLQGTNMLSRLLHVWHPTAKQAVITAIDLLGVLLVLALSF